MFKKELSHCSRLILSPPAIDHPAWDTPCRWPMHRTHATHARFVYKACHSHSLPEFLDFESKRDGKVAFHLAHNACVSASVSPFVVLAGTAAPAPSPFAHLSLSGVTLRRVDYLSSPLASTYRVGQKTARDHHN